MTTDDVTHEWLMQEPKKRMPIFSWVGIISLLISMLMFGYLAIRNEAALERIETLQNEQATFTAARAPQTRAALCNGLRVAIAVITPEGQEQKEAIEVLKQNLEVLNCPQAIVELPEVQSPPPPTTTKP